MAHRRSLHSLTRIISSTSTSRSLHPHRLLPRFHSLVTLSDPQTVPTRHHASPESLKNLTSIFAQSRFFSSKGRDDESDDSSDEEFDDEEDVVRDVEGVGSEDDDLNNVNLRRPGKHYTAEEKEQMAAHIGYEVVGQLKPNEKVFKPYAPVFAVVQIGSHQFKVSNEDCIFVERLKFCEVNDKVILNKVLMLGSSSQTIIGRPILQDAAVHAVVEEHALDAKVIIFKKKRRKHYRKCNGHRQELTKLRIADIEGIEKPKIIKAVKPKVSATRENRENATPTTTTRPVANKKSERAPVSA